MRVSRRRATRSASLLFISTERTSRSTRKAALSPSIATNTMAILRSLSSITTSSDMLTGWRRQVPMSRIKLRIHTPEQEYSVHAKTITLSSEAISSGKLKDSTSIPLIGKSLCLISLSSGHPTTITSIKLESLKIRNCINLGKELLCLRRNFSDVLGLSKK